VSYRALIIEDQRLVILRALKEDGAYEHNESVLQSILQHFGHPCSRDQVRTLISWLREQGLVTVRDVAGYLVARITQGGIDAACGCSTVPGVKRPSPGSC
jgi:Fe2+ or Zn2+ uptake regulation protein